MEYHLAGRGALVSPSTTLKKGSSQCHPTRKGSHCPIKHCYTEKGPTATGASPHRERLPLSTPAMPPRQHSREQPPWLGLCCAREALPFPLPFRGPLTFGGTLGELGRVPWLPPALFCCRQGLAPEQRRRWAVPSPEQLSTGMSFTGSAQPGWRGHTSPCTPRGHSFGAAVPRHRRENEVRAASGGCRLLALPDAAPLANAP